MTRSSQWHVSNSSHHVFFFQDRPIRSFRSQGCGYQLREEWRHPNPARYWAILLDTDWWDAYEWYVQSLFLSFPLSGVRCCLQLFHRLICYSSPPSSVSCLLLPVTLLSRLPHISLNTVNVFFKCSIYHLWECRLVFECGLASIEFNRYYGKLFFILGIFIMLCNNCFSNYLQSPLVNVALSR